MSTNGKPERTNGKPAAPPSGGTRPALITGGAGFVGCNLAHRLLSQGRRVVLFDNLSRPGVELNVAWLRATHGPLLDVVLGDVRDRHAVRDAVSGCAEVYHLAAQVAVTTSLDDPGEDFEINARGTLNVLEAIRAEADPPPLIFTSTNKVYGDLEDLQLVRTGRRYEPSDTETRTSGIGEERPLDFHSPYGCSKGSADQYVRDYARSFGLRTVVFRMSCIYGPHQFGTEDQGWVAHFLIRALDGEPIMVYGDGLQVRDVLFVDDLVDAFLLARANVDRISGAAYNIGGGPRSTTSLRELLRTIESLTGEKPDVAHHPWRTGDQRYYVSNTGKFEAATGWRAKVSFEDGVRALHDWLLESRVKRSLPHPVKTVPAQRPASPEVPLLSAQHRA